METNSEKKNLNPQERSVLVCQYTSCTAVDSAAVLAAFEAAQVDGFTVIGTGCQGQCSSGPTVRVLPEETWYCRVQQADVPVIVEQHLKGGKPVEEKLHPRIHMRYSY